MTLYAWMTMFAATATISMDFSATGQVVGRTVLGAPIVPITFRDSSQRFFLVDSGSTRTAVSKNVARALNLGEDNDDRPQPIKLTVCAEEVIVSQVEIADLSAISEAFGMDIDGIVGVDLLRDLTIDIDYGRRIVTVANSDSFLYQGGGIVVPVSTSRGVVSLCTIQTNTSQEHGIAVLIDTGSNVDIMLQDAHLARFVEFEELIASTAHAKERIYRTMFSELRTREIALHKFTFGGLSFHDVRAEVAENLSTYQGVMGAGRLSQFRLILDCLRSRVILEQPDTLPNSKVKLGFGLMATRPNYNRFFVRSIEEDSSASKSQIKKGDEVLSVNGIGVSNLDLEGVSDLLHRAVESSSRAAELKILRNQVELLVVLQY